MQKTKNRTQKEGLYKTVYKCDIYARYLEYQPKPRQFTSNVRPSTCLVRKENKAYLNFLSVLVVQVIEEKM